MTVFHEARDTRSARTSRATAFPLPRPRSGALPQTAALRPPREGKRGCPRALCAPARFGLVPHFVIARFLHFLSLIYHLPFLAVGFQTQNVPRVFYSGKYRGENFDRIKFAYSFKISFKEFVANNSDVTFINFSLFSIVFHFKNKRLMYVQKYIPFPFSRVFIKIPFFFLFSKNRKMPKGRR